MTIFLIVIFIAIAGVLWCAHREHETALELIRGDLAVLYAEYNALRAKVEPPK